MVVLGRHEAPPPDGGDEREPAREQDPATYPDLGHPDLRGPVLGDPDLTDLGMDDPGLGGSALGGSALGDPGLGGSGLGGSGLGGLPSRDAGTTMPDAPVLLGAALGADPPSPSRSWRSRLVRHLPFAVILVAGAVLRAITAYAYRPAFEFSGDSYAYLRLATLHSPDPMRPAGYPAFLRVLSFTGDLWWVTVVQHVAGLALGVALYALLVHRRVAAAVAALAAAPILLDAYELVIEHYVMAETLFAVLLVGALLALTWSPRPSAWACVGAGLLLAAAGLVRTIGVAIAVLAVLYLVVRRVGWLRFGGFAAALAVPLVAYAAWFHDAHGKYALTGGDAVWMYGRVAPIAECDRLRLKPAQLVLCSAHPVAERPDPSYYVWSGTSPHWKLPGTDDEKEALLRDFTHQVIRHQFGDYARMVGGEIVHYFKPGRSVGQRDWPDATWRFPTAHVPRYLHNSEPLLSFHNAGATRVVNEPSAGHLRAYQRVGFTPGPVLAGLLVLAAVAIVVPARRRAPRLGVRGPAARRRWRDETLEHRRLRADITLLAAAGLTMLVVPAATVCFDYRYMLPVLVLFPPAAALGTRRLLLVRRSRREPDESIQATYPESYPDGEGRPDGRTRLGSHAAPNADARTSSGARPGPGSGAGPGNLTDPGVAPGAAPVRGPFEPAAPAGHQGPQRCQRSLGRRGPGGYAGERSSAHRPRGIYRARSPRPSRHDEPKLRRRPSRHDEPKLRGRPFRS
ncbi:conserved membrane hypothetical protein [Frankia canadensis]|uniref:Uncharacterized protein n=1 Tax=Frankia canadensis TaxID=1836972 RepID=A0A2I2KKL6_9ACTN|nr:hypothetical protein [Frankia canadensis]SNQ46187.1 conserved membrane hypothetical protein [Frankia canadensis]SOU53477.1 conserved membrane hypothetical protein [Frankia canadensis]